MNFLKSLGGLVGSSAATGGLPYVIDAPPSAASGDASLAPDGAGVSLPDFHLLAGHAKGDATHAVSVFKSKQGASQPTLNALKRIKTLRHPNILSYVDGVETPSNGPVIIVTEPVVPLPQYLDDLRRAYGTSDEFHMSVAWGLRSVLLALQFLNNDCKMLHGRVHPLSVFVTKGGDWKLGGLELTGELTADGPSYVYTAFEQFADAAYKAPECQRREWKTLAQAPPSAADMYAFAALVYYVFNDSQLRVNDLSNATNVPHALRMQFRKAVDADPRRRPSPAKVLASSYFDTAFIKRMDFLENLAIKTPEEKVEYYKDLCNNLATLPHAFGAHKVLPALKAVVEFGAQNSGKNAPVKLDPSASHMLPAMVQIGSSLPAEEFKEQVLPVIVKLFSCNDRAVRVQLLQMMEKFAVHFDAKLVNSPVVFDNLCSGFTDAAPVLRELTVKSMLHIADKLSDSNLNTRVMKYFAKLQTDPEPAIRTNTTICLGRIAPKLNDATRPKVLFPAFSRAMRDPFPHARLAGLRSLTACEEFFSPQGMAGSIVPAIAPLLLDVSVTVREQAAQSMNLFMKKVMDEAAQMKSREEQQAQEQKLKQETDGVAAGGNASSSSSSSHGSNGSVSVAASGSSYAASLTSWAASAVASKIVGSGSSSGATPPASSSSAPPQPKPTSSFPSSSSSGFGSPPTVATSSAFAAADDFGGDDDAWGEDDDLDGLGSPQAPATSTSKSSFGSSPFSSAPRPASSSMKLNVSVRPPASSSAVSSSSVALPSATDGGWGDDNWGGNDDLDLVTSKPAVMPAPAASTLQVGGLSSRTSSFGSATGSAPGSRTSSFGSLHSTATATSTATVSSGLDVSSVARKSVSERLAEAKAKRESLGAMKLDTSAKKKGDEWDNWDF